MPRQIDNAALEAAFDTLFAELFVAIEAFRHAGGVIERTLLNRLARFLIDR